MKRGKRMAKKKTQKNGSGFFWKLVFMVALGVFIFSGYQLFSIYQGYKAGVDEYEAVAEEVTTKEQSQEPLVAVDQKVTEEGTVLFFEEVTYQPPEVNFEELQQMNPDVIGWIEVEALPEISYPIVQGDDNDYYLHRTFKKASNSAGSIFLDYRNGQYFGDCNTIIYGHNMKNGSMFGKLKWLTEKELYKESKYIWICTPTAKYRYEIFSIQYAQAISDTYMFFPEHNEEFAAYLQDMQEKSVIDFDTKQLNKDDFVITLSTCTSNDEVRYVVQARWIATY